MARPLRVGLLVLAAAVIGCSSGPVDAEFEGLVVDEPGLMPSVVLTDTVGRPFDLVANTAGTVRLVYFGYTRCPDICSIHLTQLADVLSRPGVPTNVTVLFVTVDPARDTPEVLRAYLDGFDADFVGLTGTPDEVVQAQRAFGSIVALAESDDEDYTMGHDGRVFAFAPDGIGYTQYPHPTRQSTWVHDIPVLAGRRDAASRVAEGHDRNLEERSPT